MRWALPLALVTALGCGRRPAPVSPEGPAVELFDVKVRRVEGERVTLEARAPTLSLSPGDAVLKADEARIEVPGHGAHVEAVHLEGHLGEGNADLAEATVVTDGGVRASTPSAHYDKPEGLVSGRSGVAVQRPTLSLDAEGYRVFVREGRAEFDQAVTRTHAPSPP